MDLVLILSTLAESTLAEKMTLKQPKFEIKGSITRSVEDDFFDELFKLYSKPLFYYAAKFVDDEAAKDIVQDTFEKIWTDQSISIRHSLNSLLFTMVRNSCLHYLEKQKVRHTYIESVSLRLKMEELNFFMEERSSLIEQELEQKLNEVLENLPERCKKIFKMSRFENKKNREIAEELQISVKAVEKQITKALSIIKAELKDYLPLLIFLSIRV